MGITGSVLVCVAWMVCKRGVLLLLLILLLKYYPEEKNVECLLFKLK